MKSSLTEEEELLSEPEKDASGLFMWQQTSGAADFLLCLLLTKRSRVKRKEEEVRRRGSCPCSEGLQLTKSPRRPIKRLQSDSSASLAVTDGCALLFR